MNNKFFANILYAIPASGDPRLIRWKNGELQVAEPFVLGAEWITIPDQHESIKRQQVITAEALARVLAEIYDSSPTTWQRKAVNTIAQHLAKAFHPKEAGEDLLYQYMAKRGTNVGKDHSDNSR